MNVTTIIILAIIVLIAILLISFYFTYNNKEISLRKRAEAQRGKIEGVYDKMWKVIKQKAEVTEKYEKAFREIYRDIIAGRYSNDKGGLMRWIQEDNPEFKDELYLDLAQSIEALRSEFQRNQETMLDIIREHEVLCNTYISKWFVSNKSKIEYTIISSERAKTIMGTGLDEDIKVF